MKPLAVTTLAARWRAWVVCCLLVALPVHGVSSTLALFVGALHFHTTVAHAVSDATPASVALGSMVGWHDFRRTSANFAPVAPPHVHDALGRHVHAPGDASVIVVGESGHASSDGATPSAAVSFDAVLSAMPAVSPRSEQAVPVRWRLAAATAFASLTTAPLERPPNTPRA